MTRRGRDGSTNETAPKRTAAEPPKVTGVTAGRGGKAASRAAPAKRGPAPKKKGMDAVPPVRRAFAANLARLRKAASLTQDELAARSGVSQSHLSALEKGTWEPRLTTIMALSKAFGVTPAALVAGWDGD